MKTISKLIYVALAVVSLATGAVTAQGALNDLFVSINSDGSNGGGSINEYTPTGVQSLFASGLSQPRGMAFDRFGNLLVANSTLDVNQTLQGTIIKISPGGVQSLFANVLAQGPIGVFLEGLAFDHAGNLFVMAINLDDPNLASTIYKFTPDGTQSTFGSVTGQGEGIAFDSAGNLFAANAGPDQTIYKFTPDGTRSVFVGPEAFDPDHGPICLAFDRFGNLFVSLEGAAGVPCSNDRIVKFTPEEVESDFSTQVCFPWGLAFDRSGNLLVTERSFTPLSGAILKFTPDGNFTVFASEVDDPTFLAFQLLPTPRPRPTPHPRPTQQF
jgi:DNA-binding beta-propeller fold protein YncE